MSLKISLFFFIVVENWSFLIVTVAILSSYSSPQTLNVVFAILFVSLLVSLFCYLFWLSLWLPWCSASDVFIYLFCIYIKIWPSGICLCVFLTWGFPIVRLLVKNLPANAGDVKEAVSISGLGESPGVGRGNLLHYSCLENPMDRGTWQAPVNRVTKK